MMQKLGFKNPENERSASKIAFLFGIVATWWVGAILGTGIAAVSQVGDELPPVEIQDEIVREVQADREALARLITHTQEEIALLKELRAATIADAVLGRVDVRSLTQKQ